MGFTTFPAFNVNTTADEVVAAFPDQVRGRVFVVTGPSPKGIGEATVTALARGRPAALLLVGHNPPKYAPVVDAVRTIDPAVDVRVYNIDLGSLASVRAGAQQILAKFRRIDVLINNAGMTRGDYATTEDGIEQQFAVNHVGHFLLTNLLMPALLKSDTPRVVNVSSAGHALGTGDYSDYNFERQTYTWLAGYGQAKLANVQFSQQLTAVFGSRGVTAFSLHPGTIWATELGRFCSDEQNAFLRDMVAKRPDYKEKTPGQGASTTLVAALDPKLKGINGAYLNDCQPATPVGPGVRSRAAPGELWRLSEALVGEKFGYQR
ncbi:WW domain-containing oxidoreductase [Auricularia subglabra TFB-10046 SS5]|nr:WW domain-containing oxidoreductase [Auricularia subglabra TFB-10046 SS5]